METHSDHTYSLFWVELSRLLGEKIPVAIVGLEPGTPGSAVQRFNQLATKQPPPLQSSALTTWPPSNLMVTSPSTVSVGGVWTLRKFLHTDASQQLCYEKWLQSTDTSTLMLHILVPFQMSYSSFC